MNHHPYDERKPMERLPSDNYQGQYYSTTGTYQSTSYASTSTEQQQTGGNEQQKNEFLLLHNEELDSDTGQMKTESNSDPLNAYMDSFFVDTNDPSTSSPGDDADREREKNNREGLELLLTSTADMADIQNQIQQEQLEISDKFREDRNRQRRATAARDRYHKMAEEDRRIYNHKRRLKQLGLDPSNSDTDMQLVQAHVKEANAKKAEAARQRYHRMSADQKRDYNMRRTEAFRRRRLEEEMLLSTPAGRISADALAKAQQIMVRNARKAESARLRYQRMSPEERKAYNMKRAAAKKTRRAKPPPRNANLSDMELLDMESDIMRGSEDEVDVIVSPMPIEIVEEQMIIQPKMEMNGVDLYEPITVDSDTQEQHMLDVINEVAGQNPTDCFSAMEKEVMRRTKQAHIAIQRQQEHMSLDTVLVGELVGHAVSSSNNAIVGGIQYDMAPSMEHDMLLDDSESPQPQHEADELICEVEEKSQMIDEKLLHEMIRSGLDLQGHPIEIRTAAGVLIRGSADLIKCQGQTILIHQKNVETKPTEYFDNTPTSSYNVVQSHPAPLSYEQIRYQEEQQHPQPSYIPRLAVAAADKQAMNRAKRAERARARYHRMSVDQRREQNAKRAAMLRKSRARDDELCQIAETLPSEQIDEDTQKQINEAQARRNRRADQARAKYHRMNADQRRQYNAMRDAQRRQRKREQDRIRREAEADGMQRQRLMSDQLDDMDGDDVDPTSPHDSVLFDQYELYHSDDWHQ